MKSIFKTFFLLLCIVANINLAFAQTASLLPNAKQQFLDNNGKPLTSGTVDFYIPSTTTRKTTWQNSSETVSNTNPVVLDAGGRALIYGEGTYRQVVKDRLGNQIWDQITSSSGSGSSSPTATGDGDLVGTIKPWSGMVAPNQYAMTYGQEISRTTYSALFTAITSTQGTFCSSGSPIITGLSDTTNLWIGAPVELSCVAAGFSTIISKTATTVTLAANANVTVNINAIFFPWGRGNGTTTFNVPDFRGLVPYGNNNMGGVASSNISIAFFGSTSPNSIGALGGQPSTVLLTSNLPPYTPSGTIVSTLSAATASIPVANLTSVGGATDPNRISLKNNANTDAGSLSAGTSVSGTVTSTFTGTAQSGTSTAFSRVMPSRTINYIIKITPDTNSATASGVTLLGGMTGSIACGAGLLCTGNSISVNIVSTTDLVRAANRVVLKALDTTIVKTVFLGESGGREGLFNWTLGDFTAAIAADTNEGVYIKANAISAGTGAWTRSFDFINYQSQWFGAVADYNTDNTTLINSMIVVANVQNTSSSNGKQTATFVNVQGGVKFASQSISWLPAANWIFVYIKYFGNSDTTPGAGFGEGTNELHTISVNSGYNGDVTGTLVAEEILDSPNNPARRVNIIKNIDNSIYKHIGVGTVVQPTNDNPARGTPLHVTDETLERFRVTYENYGTINGISGVLFYHTNRATQIGCTGCNGAGAWGGNIPAVGTVVRDVTAGGRYVVTSLATANALQTDWLSSAAVPGNFLMSERAIFVADISGTTMTVSSFLQGSGNLAVGQRCVGMYLNSGIIAGTDITVSAGGGTGAYTVDTAQTIAATVMTCGYVSANGIFGGGVTNTDTTKYPFRISQYGDMVVTTFAFASLNTCNSNNKGAIASVSDSNTNTWGANVAGGGANQILSYCNGTNWTVSAK